MGDDGGDGYEHDQKTQRIRAEWEATKRRNETSSTSSQGDGYTYTGGVPIVTLIMIATLLKLLYDWLFK